MLPGAGDTETHGTPADAGTPLRATFVQSMATAFEEERSRWFYWVPVFVGCGALIYFGLPFEPNGAAVAALLAAAITIRATGVAGTFSSLLTGALVCAAIGFTAAKVRTEVVRAPVLAGDLGPVRAAGFVELIESRGEAGQRLTLRTTAIHSVAPADLPARIRIGVRPAVDTLLPGAHVALTAKLSPPPRASVPGGYDFARYAYFRGIGAVGYATTPPTLSANAEQTTLLREVEHVIARVRKRIGDRVTAALPGQTGAIAKALINGDRSGIAEETNEAYRASGLFHILSISGLHMAIMGGSVFFFLRFVLALSPTLALNFPIKNWAAAGAILGALGYLLISGGSFATVRSFLMIAVFFLSILADRPAIALRNVALAALLILLLFPESVIDPGFQMSFAAVIGLVAGYEAMARRTGPLLDTPRTWLWRTAGFFGAIIGSTLVASAAVAPIGIYHFHQVQHFAVLANLFAVPLCNLVVMPAALAALLLMPLGGEGLALAIMGPGLEAMGLVAEWVAGLNGSVSHVPAMPTLAIGLIVAGGLWLCLMRARWRLLGIVAIAAGVVVAPTMQPPDLLIGDRGRLVVMRDAAGKLSGLTNRYSDYELSRWLARDGDLREPGEVGIEGTFLCDATGCAGRLRNGPIVAVSKEVPALREDCRRATILVVAGRLETGRTIAPGALSAKSCPFPKLIVDRKRLGERGTHAIYLTGEGALRVDTVAQFQGVRPWSQQEGRR